jgi:hypothetical protein
VDEDAERTVEITLDLRKHPFDFLGFTDIALDKDGFRASILSLLGGIVSGVVVREIVDRNPVYAALGELENNPPTDATRTTGHERRLPPT